MTQIESELERQVREEQEAHERTEAVVEAIDEHFGADADADDPEPEPEATGQTTLIDKTRYDREDLQVPKVDGQTIDRLALKFTGTVYLDRSDPSDVAVYNELALGRDVELLLAAKCSSTGASGATDRDGDLDVVVGTKGLKVHSLRKPAGADWVQDA